MSRQRVGARRGDGHEAGFTLVELVAVIAVLSVIAIPLAMTFATGVSFLARSDEKFNDSRSALVSSAYFPGDVAGALTVVPNDASGCGGGAAIVSFGSSDASGGISAPATNEVSYFYDTSASSNVKLVRKACLNGASAIRSVAAVSLGSTPPVVTCYDAANAVNASCATAHWVKLVVTQKTNTPGLGVAAPVAYSFTLEGTRRSP
jgi:prepilin-type N-terminal cleavage/methylation domain-containing protein